eukprot:TRINITY_DN7972_c0_g1_i1.p1 TRINITY_DN7972_c0_g1~~TRINITY_DN7972_c0_g1_i1.p1  ORF type:complete len:69 (-),score=18.85 TRINITY_DN7972_c0_g1_i1:57-263(-)
MGAVAGRTDSDDDSGDEDGRVDLSKYKLVGRHYKVPIVHMKDIKLGDRIGNGGYGAVYKGKWQKKKLR